MVPYAKGESFPLLLGSLGTEYYTHSHGVDGRTQVFGLDHSVMLPRIAKIFIAYSDVADIRRDTVQHQHADALQSPGLIPPQNKENTLERLVYAVGQV